MNHQRIPQQTLHWEAQELYYDSREIHREITATLWKIKEGAELAENKLERSSEEGSAKNGTHLGGSRGGSSQQIRMASACGPVRLYGREMNQRPRTRLLTCCKTIEEYCQVYIRIQY